MTDPAQLAEAVLNAAGSALRHYSLGSTRQGIIDAAAKAMEPHDIQVSKLVSALEQIESQAICVGIRHDLDEADDWLHDIAQQAIAALAAFQEGSNDL